MERPDTIKVDIGQLVDRIQEGRSPEELMEEFNIPERSVLLNGLAQIEKQRGERLFVPGLIGRPSVEGRHTGEGKRVDPAMLEGTDLPRGPSDLDRVRAEAEGDATYAVTIDQGTLVFTRRR